MPTIDISRADLCALIRANLSVDEIEKHLQLVKAEPNRRAPTPPEQLRVELEDTTRPDTGCVGGVARQIRQWLQKSPWRRDYGFLEGHDGSLEKPRGVSPATIEVDPSVTRV